jgi:hypothetical protein
MSKAGQNTFSGISHQADITLLTLLQNLNDPNFKEVIIEGKNWEDFTLVFSNRKEDYEVKWHASPLSYEDVRKIIRKELKKKFGENDRLVIVAKKISKKFLEDYRFLKSGLFWWASLTGKPDSESRAVRRLIKKGWSSKDMNFLIKTEIQEIPSSREIESKIEEYFGLEDPFYLNKDDQVSLVGRAFKNILQKGSVGGTVTKIEFLNELNSFKKGIAEKSESFSPEFTIRDKIIKVDPFLANSKEFQKLDHSRYLSPLSDNRRLIFFIARRIESSQFTLASICFFIEKVLLKRHYSSLCIRLLTKKWEQKLAHPDYFVSFVRKNYSKFTLSVDYDSSLKILTEIAEGDSNGKHMGEIFQFLKKEILNPLSFQTLNDEGKKERGWREKQLMSKIVTHYFGLAANKSQFIDFVFNYFDFTGDDFRHVMRTDPGIYSLLKNYIRLNLKRNFKEIHSRIIHQYQTRYSGRYNGYELIGGGISQAGSDYSLADIGIVRMVFRPLFEEIYAENKDDAWAFFRDSILKGTGKAVSADRPLFLRRALISILLDRLEDSGLSQDKKDETLTYLIEILMTRKGIPSTHEIIFSQIRQRDFQRLGLDIVMLLLKKDCVKFKSKNDPAGYPTNLFAIQSLIKLIEYGYKPARQFYLALVKMPKFIKYDRFYDSFELLGVSKVFQNDPDFIYEVFTAFDLTSYLKDQERDMTWDKSGTLRLLIEKDWEEGKDRGRRIIDSLLKDPTQPILEFIGTPIRELIKTDPLKTFDLYSSYLTDKSTFRSTFQNNPYIRQNFVWLAESLAIKKEYEKAKVIIEYCFDDPDPETNNKEDTFNYHLKVKKGDDSMGISTVRGTVAWALQQFASSGDSNLMAYALEKTEILLDLDGKLAHHLGYEEPDYYVRLQGLIPLAQLVPLKRRELMAKSHPSYGNRAKSIALRLSNILFTDCETKKIHPKPLIERLAQIFTYILDISSEEAKSICDLFERNEAHSVIPILIHFSFFRNKGNQNDGFDSKWFKERLNSISKSRTPLREQLALKIFRFAEAGKQNPEARQNFTKVEPCFINLLLDYQERIYEWIYRTIEILIEWPDRYQSSIDLVRKAVEDEIKYLKETGDHKYIWTFPGDLIEAIKRKNIDDYLDLMDAIYSNINSQIHYSFTSSEIPFIKELVPTSDKQKEKQAKILGKLKDLYPDEFDISDLQ